MLGRGSGDSDGDSDGDSNHDNVIAIATPAANNVGSDSRTQSQGAGWSANENEKAVSVCEVVATSPTEAVVNVDIIRA